jgi:nicotinamide phosphoribosyltransferase
MQNNIILSTDSYKQSHHCLYPEKTTRVFSYLESRGGNTSETTFFGLHYILKTHLEGQVVTQEKIERAAKVCKLHFGNDEVFNRKGWEYILDKYNGYLPLKIKAVKEGEVVSTRNVLMTIENTDDNCWWLTNFVESVLLHVWYSISVSTLSREIKKVILKYLISTGTPESIPFRLHCFGYRGAASQETAAIGTSAHLVNFMGTDTMPGLELLAEYYGEEMAGYSIPATEHSIACARGREGEVDQMQQFLDTYGKKGFPVIAYVSDGYDIWNACRDYWGSQLRAQVENLGNTLLGVRGDSGDPVVVPIQIVETLAEVFGTTTNDKGYKVLNHVRVVQGDGVNLSNIQAILEGLKTRGFSADNITFGVGGALLSSVNRDTHRFAIKASSYVVDGYVKNYRKDPITDSGKRSKLGRLKLVKENGVYNTVSLTGDDGEGIGLQDELITVFENGKILYEPNFAEIRERAKIEMDGYRL